MTDMNVVEVESAISNLAGAYPSLCNLVTSPNLTIEGRTSRALRISNGGFGTRDAVMMIGGVHAREWGSCEILVKFATDLLTAFSTNAGLAYGGKTFTAGEVQAIMNSVEFVIFPLVNAYGRFFSQRTTPRSSMAGAREETRPRPRPIRRPSALTLTATTTSSGISPRRWLRVRRGLRPTLRPRRSTVRHRSRNQKRAT